MCKEQQWVAGTVRVWMYQVYRMIRIQLVKLVKIWPGWLVKRIFIIKKVRVETRIKSKGNQVKCSKFNSKNNSNSNNNNSSNSNSCKINAYQIHYSLDNSQMQIFNLILVISNILLNDQLLVDRLRCATAEGSTVHVKETRRTS